MASLGLRWRPTQAMTLHLLLFLVFFSSPAHSLTGEKTIVIESSPYLWPFQKFGFEKNGTLSVSTNSATLLDPTSRVYFLLCRDSEYKSLIEETQQDTNEVICQKDNHRPQCELVTNFTNPILKKYYVKDTDMYHLLLASCADKTFEADIKYTLLNPDQRHLGVGQRQLPLIYTALTFAWSALVAYWIGHCVVQRRYFVVLHALVGVVLLLKLSVVLSSLAYWRICDSSGNCYQGLSYLQSFSFSISESFFFCTLLLIAKGWRITRNTLPTAEVRTIVIALVLLLSTLVFFSFYNEGYYFLSLMIMYFFMLPKILTSITQNTRALTAQLLVINGTPPPPTAADFINPNDYNAGVLAGKLRVFKVLRTFVILYLGAILVVSSLRFVIAWYLEWVYVLASEVIVLAMVAVVAYCMRPRGDGMFAPLGSLFLRALEEMNASSDGPANWDPTNPNAPDGIPLRPLDNVDVNLDDVYVVELPSGALAIAMPEPPPSPEVAEHGGAEEQKKEGEEHAGEEEEEEEEQQDSRTVLAPNEGRDDENAPLVTTQAGPSEMV